MNTAVIAKLLHLEKMSKQIGLIIWYVWLGLRRISAKLQLTFLQLHNERYRQLFILRFRSIEPSKMVFDTNKLFDKTDF